MKRVLLILALLVVAVSIFGLQTGAYLQFEKLFGKTSSITSPVNRTETIAVNTIINYGNNTSIWSNLTKVPPKWNFYNLTLFVTDGRIDSSFDTALQEHYITGINGVEQSPNSPNYWALWIFCIGKNAWTYSNLGADDLTLSNNASFGWYYSTGNSPPVFGAQTVTAC